MSPAEEMRTNVRAGATGVHQHHEITRHMSVAEAEAVHLLLAFLRRGERPIGAGNALETLAAGADDVLGTDSPSLPPGDGMVVLTEAPRRTEL